MNSQMQAGNYNYQADAGRYQADLGQAQVAPGYGPVETGFEYQGAEAASETPATQGEKFFNITTDLDAKSGPQYLTSPTGMKVLNYQVYKFSFFELIFTALIIFLVGAVVGFIFFGNLGLDEYGQKTTFTHIANLVVTVGAGLGAVIFFIPRIRKSLLQKRKTELSEQFRDMLESLTTSLGAGSNVTQAFYATCEDLKMQYDEDAYILKELEVILTGIENNFAIEDLIRDFGQRSDIRDIKSFADVFAVCFRKGGNIATVMQNTHSVLSTKMTISKEIEATMASSKSSLNVMMFMPVMLIGVMKGMGGDLGNNFGTPIGVASTIVACILFVIAYVVGQKVMEIKV